MSSKIGWTDGTYNPWRGCEKISAGCKNCYAEVLSERNPKALGYWGRNAPRVVAAPAYFGTPLTLQRLAKKDGVRKRLFTCSLADFFEQFDGEVINPSGHPMYANPSGAWVAPPPNSIPGERLSLRPLSLDDIRLRVLDQIPKTPLVDWLILTKRAADIVPTLRRLASGDTMDPGVAVARDWLAGRPPKNAWLGASVENRATAFQRIDHLRDAPAVVHWLSVEPLLEALDITPWLEAKGIDWVVVGGESGNGGKDEARQCHIEWLRDIALACTVHNVPYFVKQLGSKPIEDTPLGGERLLRLGHPKGEDLAEWPLDLRVQDYPTVLA